MQVLVSGQHLAIGASLQEYVKDRVVGSINKYFDHASGATVHFHKQNHEFSSLFIAFFFFFCVHNFSCGCPSTSEYKARGHASDYFLN